MPILNKRSLFAILSRLPWWVSILVGTALFMAVRQFVADFIAAAAGLPFLVIAVYSAWRASREATPEQIEEALARVRAMSWPEFSALMQASFGAEGYSVAPLVAGAADLELRKDGRTTLVACKRWKVAQTGVDALRELAGARAAADASGCIYVSAGALSRNAQEFAAQKNIRLLSDVELAQLILRGKAA